MRHDTELLNNVYRHDSIFLKLNEIYERRRNYRRNKIVDNQRDIVLLRLKTDFTKIPNILMHQLTEINFRCKDCFKAYILMYKFTLTRNSMRFKCKKEYLRKMIKINRQTLNRVLIELEEKNMLLSVKENGYFYFTLNLSFDSWNLLDNEKEEIKLNNEREIEKWQIKYLDEDNIFDTI